MEKFHTDHSEEIKKASKFYLPGFQDESILGTGITGRALSQSTFVCVFFCRKMSSSDHVSPLPLPLLQDDKVSLRAMQMAFHEGKGILNPLLGATKGQIGAAVGFLNIPLSVYFILPYQARNRNVLTLSHSYS